MASIYLIIAAFFLFVAYRYLKAYFRYRGKMVVTCPETQKTVGVEVDAAFVAGASIFSDKLLTLSDCTRWPERKDCGQECLSQIGDTPENCLVKTRLMDWYQSKDCVYCGKPFDTIHWHDHKPALRNPNSELIEWDNLLVEHLPEILATHKPVCWNCWVAESFRRDFPDLVTDRPEHSHLV
jgi:hypothetical protein